MNELSIIQGIYSAMNNSYKMIVIKKTIEEIIYNNTDKYIFFAHDIEKDPDVEDIKFILNHFEELEEFEKCIELYKLIDANET